MVPVGQGAAPAWVLAGGFRAGRHASRRERRAEVGPASCYYLRFVTASR
jgi:hypothetical protein